MNKNRFIELVEKLPEIESLFTPTTIETAVFYGEKMGYESETIRHNQTYQTWRVSIELELDSYNHSQIVEEVRRGFRDVDRG